MSITPQTGFSYVARSWRGLSYISFIVASICSMIYPSDTIGRVTSPGWAVMWAFLFFVSAAVCAIGVYRENWVIEYFGLPLLTSVFFILSVTLFLGVTGDNKNLLGFGFVALGVALHLLFRAIELRAALRRNITTEGQ